VFKRLLAAALAAGLAASCSGASDEPPLSAQAVAAAPSVSIPAGSWWAVLVAGDNSSPAFDNGIDTLRERFAALGVRNITLLSASQARGARLASARAVDGTLRAAGGEACFVYMTSHGDESGFFLRAERRTLSPAALDQALSAGCGERPTVVVVSACHSGTFINATRRPNRIIVTAAAADRTSFGCGADDDYTYYDQCFLQQLDSASTWRELAEATRGCVATLEQRLGVRRESRPQIFVGAAVANLKLPGR
jgi:hypothetical protein